MDAMQKIADILCTACNKDVTISPVTDLFEEKILDSLDALVFFMAFEEAFGVHIPDDVDLKEEGFYTIPKLLSLLDDAA